MSTNQEPESGRAWPKLSLLPVPAKALVTAIILTISIAMVGALGQIVIHDIIPTFFAEKQGDKHAGHQMQASTRTGEEKTENLKEQRGDLFAGAPVKEKTSEEQPFYKTENFVWLLKWSHIHLFGMNLIFIFIGTVTFLLDLSAKARTVLIILPFVGVLIDIAAMWLKAYVSPAFFWLHLPGGGLFGAIFIFVSGLALWEMWQPRLFS